MKFYPADCHARPSRREFVAGSLALGALSWLSPVEAQTAGDGTTIIKQYANVPEDPWALAHGIRAMGATFTARGGRRAVDVLLEQAIEVQSANGKSVLGYALATEIHPNSFLKTMLEAGVPLDYRFSRGGARSTLADVVEGARQLFRPQAALAAPNTLPWSVIAFSRTTSPVRPTWTNAWGEAVDLVAVAEASLQVFERASAPVGRARDEGGILSQQAPVHGFTCGGTHMLYSVLAAAQAGHLRKDAIKRLRAQVDLMVWRMGADVALIQRFYEGKRSHAVARLWETDSKLKILGHAEECVAFAERHGIASLTEQQQEQRRQAVAVLRRIVVDLEKDDLRQARTVDADAFRQVIGDVCHARHGFALGSPGNGKA